MEQETHPLDVPMGPAGMRALRSERDQNRDLRAALGNQKAEIQRLKKERDAVRSEHDDLRKAIRFVVDDAYSETGGYAIEGDGQ